MPDPPSPGFGPLLLELLGRVAWVRIPFPGIVDGAGEPLGVFGGFCLVLARGNEWAAIPDPSTAPMLGPFFLTEQTARVLQEGAPAGDTGSIIFERKTYRVLALTEAGRNIARAVEVPST